MSTRNNKDQTGRPVLRLVFFLVTALILGCFIYILSIGPVLCLAERMGLGRTHYVHAMRAFYRPVFFVARSSTSGAKVYESYLDMWSRIVLNTNYRNPPPTTSVEGLLASVGSITNGQGSFELFVSNNLTIKESPTSQDVAMSLIIGKVRDHGLFPAGFKESPTGRFYSFQRVRSWETKDK